MTRRLERVAKTIKQELAVLISQLRHPDVGFVTVTKVEPSADLRVAKVYISVLPTKGHEDPEVCLNAVQHSAGFLQSNLAQVIRSKLTPELRFHLDDSIEKTATMSEILRKTKESAIPFEDMIGSSEDKDNNED